MGEFDYRNKDSNHDYNYTPQKNAHSAQDNLGNDWIMNILNRFAQTKVSNNPLVEKKNHPLTDDEAKAAVEFNHGHKVKDYNWKAIAQKLGSPSLNNDEETAQAIARHQIKYKAELEQTNKKEADQFSVDGKMGPNTRKALNLIAETQDYLAIPELTVKDIAVDKTKNQKLPSAKLNTNVKVIISDDEKSKGTSHKSNSKDTIALNNKKNSTTDVNTIIENAKKSNSSVITLTPEKIQKAISENNRLIAEYEKEYEGDVKYEKKRILKSVGSDSTEFDESAILSIARWQAQRGLVPDGIYGSKSREADLVLTLYQAAEGNTDLNINFLVAQLYYESGGRFQSSTNNYGGIKAKKAADGVNPENEKTAALRWTHEKLTDAEAKEKKEKYQPDPKRSTYVDKKGVNTGEKVSVYPEDKNITGEKRYHVQEWFQIFDSIESFIKVHRNVVVSNVLKVVKKKYPKQEQQEAVRRILDDQDALLAAVKESKYATGDYKLVGDRMEKVQTTLNDNYGITTDRKQTPKKETEET